MAKDDYFRIVYAILTELYGSRKENQRVDLDSISAERFGINEGYLIGILKDLLDEGYTRDYIVKNSKTGRFILSLEEIEITPKGIEYLQENSLMKKVAKVLKGVKDIAPESIKLNTDNFSRFFDVIFHGNKKEC